MRILHLTLKKKWFDMIASGEKKEDYRELKPYWFTRLTGRDYDVVSFRHGYQKNAPTMVVEYKGVIIGEGNKKWGWQEESFVIKLGNIISIKNYQHGRTTTPTT